MNPRNLTIQKRSTVKQVKGDIFMMEYRMLRMKYVQKEDIAIRRSRRTGYYAECKVCRVLQMIFIRAMCCVKVTDHSGHQRSDEFSADLFTVFFLCLFFEMYYLIALSFFLCNVTFEIRYTTSFVVFLREPTG